MDRTPVPFPGRRRGLTGRLAQWIDGIAPYSWEAFFIAAASLAIATLARAAAGWTGPDLRLATYFPAILASGLLAGVPAGLAVTVLSGVIVWWAFTSPFFEFKTLIASDEIAFGMYAAAAGCTLLFAHWCRLILRELFKQQRMNEMITRELEHRGRNIFAIFEVIVQKTLAHDAHSAQTILGRLRALRFANELLTQPEQKPISLADLLDFEFAGLAESRFTAFGPHIELAPEAARHLILIVHELVTNATKYGALSVPSGRVVITWRLDTDKAALKWREEGGPPVQAPERNGFGTRLVTQCVAEISGTIKPEFGPRGFECEIRFPLSNSSR